MLPATIGNVASDGLALAVQSGGDGGGIAGLLGGLFGLLFFGALILIPIAGMWKTFEKAGQPGWGALIPVLNLFYLLEIADKETWWLVLFFIPVINFFISIIVMIDVAKNFGKGPGYGLGLALLSVIFWPLLGFGDAEYVGDQSAGV